MSQLQNKVAIVTGAAGGFGAEIARAYVREGAKVIIADINLTAAQKLAQELGPSATAVSCDVTDAAQVNAAVRLCVSKYGVPDIVVNNAGTTHKNQPLLDVDEATFDRVFAINVKSIYHMTHAVVPLLRERNLRQPGKGGVILNVGSVAGIRPRPGLTWVQQLQGRGQHAVKIDGGGIGAGPHPGQCDLPGNGRDRFAGAIHGRTRYGRKPGSLYRYDSIGPHVRRYRHCQCGRISGH